jgi:hypothetical protein
MKKWIQIWYSWGDQESPVEVPDGIDAWEYMKELAATEVFVSQEEHPYGCTIWPYPDEYKIVLKYHCDDEYCYYLATEDKDYNVEGD